VKPEKEKAQEASLPRERKSAHKCQTLKMVLVTGKKAGSFSESAIETKGTAGKLTAIFSDGDGPWRHRLERISATGEND